MRVVSVVLFVTMTMFVTLPDAHASDIATDYCVESLGESGAQQERESVEAALDKPDLRQSYKNYCRHRKASNTLWSQHLIGNARRTHRVGVFLTAAVAPTVAVAAMILTFELLKSADEEEARVKQSCRESDEEWCGFMAGAGSRIGAMFSGVVGGSLFLAAVVTGVVFMLHSQARIDRLKGQPFNRDYRHSPTNTQDPPRLDMPVWATSVAPQGLQLSFSF